MAKISAHGAIIGTVYFTTAAKRYMSDGVILVNKGFGWKLGPKLKPGVNPQQAFENQKLHAEEYAANNPALTAYRKKLHALAGMDKRWKLHAAVTMMPNDYDGVWSECCDGYGDNIHADVNEIADLCRAYQWALQSQNEAVAD